MQLDALLLIQQTGHINLPACHTKTTTPKCLKPCTQYVYYPTLGTGTLVKSGARCATHQVLPINKLKTLFGRFESLMV